MRKKPTETHVKSEKNFLAKPDQYCILQNELNVFFVSGKKFKENI